LVRKESNDDTEGKTVTPNANKSKKTETIEHEYYEIPVQNFDLDQLESIKDMRQTVGAFVSRHNSKEELLGVRESYFDKKNSNTPKALRTIKSSSKNSRQETSTTAAKMMFS